MFCGRWAALAAVAAILTGMSGSSFLPYETVYVMTAVKHYDEKGVHTKLTTYAYDRNGRILERAYYYGPREEIWDDEQMTYITSSSDEIGDVPYAVTQYQYDGDGNLTQQTKTSGYGSTLQVSTYQYEKTDGLVTGLTTASDYGNTRYVLRYDGHSRVKEICTLEENGEEAFYASFGYDEQGRVTQYAVSERVYTYTYSNDRLAAVHATGPEAYNALEYDYDSQGKLLDITANGEFSLCACEYDSRGNLEEMELQGTTFTFAYDGTTLTDGEMRYLGTKLTYDRRGNLIKRIYADGSCDRFTYKRMFLSEADAMQYYRSMYQELEFRHFMINVLFRRMVNLPMDPKWELRRLFVG